MISIFASLFAKPMPYLDPGTGGMIIQLAIAAVMGAGVLLGVFWKKIKAFFTGKKLDVNTEYDPTEIIDGDPTDLPPTKE